MAIPLYGQEKQGGDLKKLIDDKHIFTFSQPPILMDDSIYGGAWDVPDGAAQDVVIHQYPNGLQLSVAYMCADGAGAEDGPVVASTGMNYVIGDTDNEGLQWVMSYPGTKGIEGFDSFTVGRYAFYAKLKYSLSDVSVVDYSWFGFRLKSQAAVAEPRAGATDYAVIGPNAGNISVETALNNTTASVLDTTDDWGDGESHTMEVRVSAAGAATFKIDGRDPTVNTTTLTFDSGDVLTPWFVSMKSSGASCDTVLQELEVGKLADIDN